MPILGPSSPTYSCDPPECFENNRVVPATTLLPIWAQKTLESIGSEISIPYDIRRTRYKFALMTKFLATNDPSTYAQAKEKPKSEKVMTAEHDSLMKNQTWNLVPLALGNNLVGCKWIYKTKFNVEGHIKKHKAQLVAKGFFQ